MRPRPLLLSTVLGLCVALPGCWNREAVWEATDAHRSSVVRPGESEAERLYRHGRDCMDTLERDDCAIDYFEQLIALEPDRRDLVGDATFRLVELYRRHDKSEDATLLLRKFWDLGMSYRRPGVVPYGARFAPETITTMFAVDVAALKASGLHADLPQDAKDMMFTCDEARREQLQAEAKARNEAHEQELLATMSEQEREDYEKRRERRRFGRRDDGERRRDPDAPRPVYSGGFCKLAAALGLTDPRDFDEFLGGSSHEDPTQSIAVIRVDELEAKLAAAVEAGRLIAEPTPAIEGRDVSAMTEIMRNKLRVWTLVDYEYDGAPVRLMSFDKNELTLAPEALAADLLHARAHDQSRLHPKLQALIDQVPNDVMFMTLVTPMAMQDFMGDMGAIGKLLPKADGLLIAAVVYDYAGLFVRVPTEDSVKAWLLLSIARKMIAPGEDDEDTGVADFMGNLDISQATDGKALMMTNILTTNAVTRMFLGG